MAARGTGRKDIPGISIKAMVDGPFRERVNATAMALGLSTSEFIALACEEKMDRYFGADARGANGSAVNGHQPEQGGARGDAAPSVDEKRARAAYELALALVRSMAPAAENDAKGRLRAWLDSVSKQDG